MPLLDDDGSYYIKPPKKKKKPPKPPSSGGFMGPIPTGSVRTSTGYKTPSNPSSYSPPSYYSPPSAPSAPPTVPQIEKQRRKREKKDKQPGSDDQGIVSLWSMIQDLKEGVDQRAKKPDVINRGGTNVQRGGEVDKLSKEYGGLGSLIGPATLDDSEVQKQQRQDKRKQRNFLTDVNGQQLDLDALGQLDLAPRGTEQGYDLPDGSLLKQAATPTIPQRYMHESNKKNSRLKRQWDQEYINEQLELFNSMEDGDFQRQLFLSEILDLRYKDKEQFSYDRLERRTEHIKQAIAEATNALYTPEDEGGPDFDYLEENYPKLDTSIRRYRQDYSITPAMLTREMNERLEGVPPGEERDAIIEQYEGYAGPIDTYENIQEQYRHGANTKSLKNKIKKFEDFYNEKLDDSDLDPDEVGPAIPVKTVEGRSEEEQAFVDASAGTIGNLDAIWTGGKVSRKLLRRRRTEIKEDLGVDFLPNVQQMLEMQVRAGLLDSDDENEVFDAIRRFKNPMHPDTRAIYAYVAQAQNPNISDEEATEFINSDYKDYVERVENIAGRRAETKAREEREADVEDARNLTGVQDFVDDSWSHLMQSDDATGRDYKDYLKTGESSDFGKGLAWTVDKLLRFNYAMAGMADTYFGMDKEPTKPWSEGNTGQQALALLLGPTSFLGKSPLDSVDELVSDPIGSVKDIASEGKTQFMQPEGTTPTTFSQVIGRNAERDGQDNFMDADWYQHSAGLVADVFLDPTTYIGVGTIGALGKFAGKTVPKTLARDAVTGVRSLQDTYTSMVYGKGALDFQNIQRLNKSYTSKSSLISRLHNPGASRIADTAWRTRQVIGMTTESELGLRVPNTADSSLPVGNDLATEIDALARQADAIRNDLVTDGMREYLEDYAVTQGRYTPIPGQHDIRNEVLLGKAADFAKRLPLDSPLRVADGEAFLYRLGAVASKEAKSQGQIIRKYHSNDLGTAAREAEGLIKQIDETYGVTDVGAATRRTELMKTIEKGTRRTEGDVMAAADNIPQHIKDSLRSVVSRAAGVEPKRLPFTDGELLEAVLTGRTKLQKADPHFDQYVKDAYAMKAQAKRSLDNATSKQAKQNARRAYNESLHTLNQATSAGMLHMLEQFEHMGRLGFISGSDGARLGRITERAVYSDPDRARSLMTLRDEITERQVTTTDESYVTAGKERSELDEFGDDAAREVENPYMGALDNLEASTLPRNDLDMVQKAIAHELKKMRLDSGGSLKGVPPLEATRLLTAAPPAFLEGGKLSTDKLMKVYRVEKTTNNPKYERYTVKWDNKIYNAQTDAGKAFIRNFGTTLRDRYNQIYVERNLAMKSDVTGVKVTTKAKHVFEPGSKAPRHVVAMGTKTVKDKDFVSGLLTKGRGENGVHKSVDSDFPLEDFKKLSSVQRNNQRIHEAIKKSDADGIPPVVYFFSDQPLSHEANKWFRQSVDYARTRGVTVMHFQYQGKGVRPKVTTFKGSDDFTPVGSDIPARSDRLKGNHPKSEWSQMHPEGIGSADEALRLAFEGGSKTGFYDTFLSPGAPFNVTSRDFLEVDDVIKSNLDRADEAARRAENAHPEPKMPETGRIGRIKGVPEDVKNYADEVFEAQGEQATRKASKGIENASKSFTQPPKPLTFMGERMPYNIAKARVEMAAMVRANLDEMPSGPKVREVAEELMNRRKFPMSREAAYRKAIRDVVVEPAIKKYAATLQKYWENLDHPVRVRLTNNILNGARAAREKGAKSKANIEASNRRRKASYPDRETTDVGNLLGPEAHTLLKDEALRDATEQLVKEVNERGSLPGSASGKRIRISVPPTKAELAGMADEVENFYEPVMGKRIRRTINETHRDVVKDIKTQYRQATIKLELQKAEVHAAAEMSAIADRIQALKAMERQQLKEAERIRKEAHEIKAIARKDDIADDLIQATFYPGADLTEKQARELVAAKKIELQSAVNRLNAPEIAAEATAHKWHQNVAKSVSHRLGLDDYNKGDLFNKNSYWKGDPSVKSDPHPFTRPSKQLETEEGREILALITGGTPVLVRQHLERIQQRMGGVLTENRKQAFKQIRHGEDSAMDYTGGIKQELDDITAIWNGKSSSYQFTLEGRPGQFSFVTWNDMAHFLPKGFMPDVKMLSAARKTKAELSIRDIFEAIPASKRSKNIHDPAVFAHTMRIAADQARTMRIGMGAINSTFGVPRHLIYESPTSRVITGKVPTKRSMEVESLAKLGWDTIDELGNSHYFHPEAVNEVRNLVRLITQRDARTEFGKLMDNVLSGWKGLHTTYSPPYYGRNLVGEVLMAWLGGVWNPAYYRRSQNAIKWLRHQDQDLADLMNQLPILKGRVAVDTADGTMHGFTLRKSGYKGTVAEAWALYGRHGLKSAFTNTEVKNHGFRAGAGATYSDRKMVRGAKGTFNKLHAFGEYMDDYPRFAHFLHALEHSGKSTIDEASRYAARRVRRYHFDYSDVSTFEKVIIGRVFPFYKWTRFSAPVMLSHMFLTPGRVTSPVKTLDASAGVLSSSDVFEDKNGHLPDYHGIAPAWVRDLWSYQISGMPGADDPYATYLRMATPQMDALTAVYQPTDGFMSLLNPAIKTAYEFATNKGMDKDFGSFPITGGGFNDMYNISDTEARGSHIGRQLGPFFKTLTDVWRGQQETDDGQSFNEYREDLGYDPWKQLLSNLNPAGFNLYQAKIPTEDESLEEVPFNPPPVGQHNLDDLLAAGRKPGVRKGQEDGYDVKNIASLLYGSSDSGSSGYNSNWVDYGNGGWRDFGGGYGGYGGYGGGGGGYGSSGYSFSRAEWADSLMELIRALKSQIDQGDVVND